MAVSQYPLLATPADIPRLISDDRVSRTWPPPGTTEQRYGFPETWVLVSGDPTEGDAGDWYVTTLGHVAGLQNQTVTQLLLAIGREFTGPIASFVSAASQWPVIYEVGRTNHMRWISSVFRGQLGSTEQFQFGLNWGNPGSDPDPNEAETLAFAETLRTQWAANWTANQPTSSPASMFTAQVKFVEVGATVKTQTDATGADGSGGNLEQKFDTQWAPWTVGSESKGTASGFALPYEVACALTLQTDKRGPSGRGRIYLPPFYTGVMATEGKFEATAPNVLAYMLGAFFEDVESATGHVPIVVSRRRIVLNEVTSVNVGYVPDAQRRRRRSQDEARTTQWTKP